MGGLAVRVMFQSGSGRLRGAEALVRLSISETNRHQLRIDAPSAVWVDCTEAKVKNPTRKHLLLGGCNVGEE